MLMLQIQSGLQLAAGPSLCGRAQPLGNICARSITSVTSTGRAAAAAPPAQRQIVGRLSSLRNHLIGSVRAMAASATLKPLAGLQVERVNCLQACKLCVTKDPWVNSDASRPSLSTVMDNYVWLLREPSGTTAIVDPSEAAPVVAALDRLGWRPDFIFNTHHHWDHTGGNEELKKKYGLKIVGPKADEGRIPGIDVALAEGDTWDFGQMHLEVFDTPGHTRGHITLYFPDAGAVFPGDTLFAMGCGRLFEGTPTQMWDSLSKIGGLPPQTVTYPAHEYTQANTRWAITVNPGNQDLQARKEQVDLLRSQGKCTLPCTLEDELKTNPFLRPEDADIRKTLGLKDGASNLEVFTAVRKHKDNF